MLTIGEEEEEEEVLCTRIDEKLGDVFSPPESHIDIDRGPPMRLAQQSRQTNESCGSMAIFDEFLLRIGGVSHESSFPPHNHSGKFFNTKSTEMIQQFFLILELLTPPRKKSSLVTGRRATNARYFMFCTC